MCSLCSVTLCRPRIWSARTWCGTVSCPLRAGELRIEIISSITAVSDWIISTLELIAYPSIIYYYTCFHFFLCVPYKRKYCNAISTFKNKIRHYYCHHYCRHQPVFRMYWLHCLALNGTNWMHVMTFRSSRWCARRRALAK